MEFGLDVSGDFACFTRPEMKAERVSYDVITPSSARAIFEAILWKPAIKWTITRIEVINPVKFMNIKRNELDYIMPYSTIKTASKKGEGDLGISITKDGVRMPRFSIILKDVRYRIYARFALTEEAGERDTIDKFQKMFLRRSSKGQCFYQPYLGCREFSCDFTPVSDTRDQPVAISQDLGWMLLDMDFTNKFEPKPMFYRAHMEKGVIQVPDRVSGEIAR